MKFIFLLAAAAFFRPVYADSAAAAIAALPPCSAKCLLDAIPAAGCSPTDIACQCNSQNMSAIVTSCILDNCQLSGILEVSRLDAKQCNRPHDDRHTAVKALGIVATVVIFGLIILRIIARLCTAGRLWWDDYFHLIAIVFSVPLAISIHLCARLNLGYHIYDPHIRSTSQLTTLFMWFYLCQIFWAIAIYFVKMSLLALYLRIFPNRSLRLAVFICMAILTLSVLTTLPMTIWQCNPISATWRVTERRHAHCLSLRHVAYANAGVNIATEVAIFIIPIPVLRRLQITSGKRVALFVLFGIGVLVIGIASARIPSLVYIDSFNDPTYNDAPAALWTTAESTIVHICATAPALRSLYSHVKRKYIDSSTEQNPSDKTPTQSESRKESAGIERKSGFDKDEHTVAVPDRVQRSEDVERGLYREALGEVAEGQKRMSWGLHI